MCRSIVSKFMPNTLHEIIHEKEMPPMDIKLYSWQLCNGLDFLATLGIVHRDLKTANVLVNDDEGHLQISDFGSALVLTGNKSAAAYQVTRSYRPPELLLGADQYGSMVDIWSVGCCIGEMLKRNVVFPGHSTSHQLELIFSALGFPTKDDIRAMRVKEIPTKMSMGPARGVARFLPHGNPEVSQFLERLLVFSPEKRLQGEFLLRHRFFDNLFVPGAHRDNGRLISACISNNTEANTEEDEESGSDYKQ